MATPGPTVSNPVTVTEAAAAEDITLTATPTELPASGGVITFSGTTNLADGTGIALYLAQNGGAAANTGQQALVSGGAFSLTYTVPPNTTLNPITDVFTAQSISPLPGATPAPAPA